MRLHMNKYPISFWNVAHMDKVENTPAARVADWNDLGITLAMSPAFETDYVQTAKAYLDECEKAGIKLILCDRRTHWRFLKQYGEAAYRAAFQQALADFDGHPALFGFFVGDEPDAENVEYAKVALRVQAELAPHLIAYLNLLPWFDWIGERMGTTYIAPYLDTIVQQGDAKFLSFDCYVQTLPTGDGKDVYFENLRNYFEAYKRHGVPYMSIVLCGSHSSDYTHYPVPSKDMLRWQLGSSVAMGAASVSWYVIDPCGMYEDAGHVYDYRDLPINALGERTEYYARLSEINRMFLQHMGAVMHTLTIDACYHYGQCYGGVPAFQPFGKIQNLTADGALIVSRFYDADGAEYYLLCNNSPTDSVTFEVTFTAGTQLSYCAWGNRFVKGKPHTTVLFSLAPGQLHLYRIDE